MPLQIEKKAEMDVYKNEELTYGNICFEREMLVMLEACCQGWDFFCC